MEGDDINSLLQDDYVLGEITMTAKEYLDFIMVKVNKNAENILKDNEYKIKNYQNKIMIKRYLISKSLIYTCRISLEKETW